EEVKLGAKTTSYKRWGEGLVEYARGEGMRAEAEYWLAVGREAAAPLPVDLPGGDNTAASTDTVSVTLDEEETRALLHEVPAAYRAQINDVLLTALARAFNTWTGERLALVDMEGHGREALFEDLDVSRTVGWFTSIFPVLLDARDSEGIGDELKTIKEQLRHIPSRGIGYGLLRYLADDASLGEALRALPQAQVSFLYLGQFDQMLNEAANEAAPVGFLPASESAGSLCDPSEKRRYLIEVSGFVAGGQLRMSWVYSRNVHRRETVEALAENFVGALRALTEHCRNVSDPVYTPSDFPEAELTQQELDDLLVELTDSEE
ncbi:MAG TPA: condensation domain-containing protein, partial [Pyrinomonadaceae bacterium]|nr:condensation domain-containing protein [Pyrinomonadaceae bacterium]